MTSAKQAEKDYARAELRELLPPGSQVFCVLEHVSKSGMSRRITPACMGSGTTGVLLALCRRTDDGSDGPCVMKAGHSGPCYGEDDVASDWQPAIAEHCPTCLNYPSGTCPPIPVKGRPRLTEWTP